MFWVHFFYAVLFAALLSIFFYAVFRTRGPWSSLLLLFLVIFLASWAGGLWLSPIGPGFRGTYWIPFLISGLIIALLLAAAAPSRREETTVELVDAEAQKREKKRVYMTLSIFFWIIVAALVAAIGIHYLG
jgi:hypothetical protein